MVARMNIGNEFKGTVSRQAITADAYVFKRGDSVDITLWGLTVSIGGDVMAGGIGGSLLLGKKGFKAALNFGVEASLQVTKNN